MNPFRWPLWGKAVAVAVVACAVVFGAVSIALTGGSHPAATAHSATSSGTQAAPSSSPSAEASQAAAGLDATCQAGSDGQPVSQQNYDPDGLDYLVAVTNDSGQPVTMDGYTISFLAYGQVIDGESPQVNAILAEPGEKWTYTGQYENAPQVSESTYLDETCKVTEIVTPDGDITPASTASGSNGNANTQSQAISAAQGNLAKDLPALQQASTALNDNKTLGGDITKMQSDWSTEQADWKTESGMSCPNQPPADGGDQVGTDADLVGTDQDQEQANVEGLQENEVAAVKTGVSSVQGDLSQLQGLGTRPSTAGGPAAVSAGNAALSSAANAISWANGQADELYKEAQALATTAENYADAHLCD